MRTHTQTHSLTHTHSHSHIRSHSHTHSHVHSHSHTHTHTQTAAICMFSAGREPPGLVPRAPPAEGLARRSRPQIRGRVGWQAHGFLGRRERRGHGSEAQKCCLDLTPETQLCAVHVPWGPLNTTWNPTKHRRRHPP